MTDLNLEHELPSSSAGSQSSELNIGRMAPALWLVGLVTLIASLAMMFGNPTVRAQMAGSYMFGFIFWLSVTIGMFGLALLHHTTQGSWSTSILRLLEAGGGLINLGLMAILFLPILLNPSVLYIWARPDVVAHDHILQWKAGYLNVPFWSFRYLFYFGIWGVWAWSMRNSTLKQDVSKNFALEERRRSGGAAGLVMFFITSTFAFTDWVMSLEPHWSSTMYGLWVVVGSALSALAFSVVIVCTNADKQPYKQIVSPDLTRDLGNMMFLMTMLWGYTSISQFLIIWNGNLPETASYYQVRSSAFDVTSPISWGALGLVLIIGQFFVPFFLLLSPRMKNYPLNLAKVAGWMFVIHIVDVYQIVVPAIPGRAHMGPISSGLPYDILAFVSIGCLWLASFATQTRKAPLLPQYDTRLKEALHNAH